MKTLVCLPMIAFSLVCASTAQAQNWSFDARAIALGATGGSENLASSMIGETKAYRSIVLPLGLLQVLQDFGRLNPRHEEFDLIKTVEYAAAPLHYQLGRRENGRSAQFAVDMRNGEISRDLNDYRGFLPARPMRALGLASPTWGRTFRVHEGAGGAFQGIYVGAGPYMAMRTDLGVDPQLSEILASRTGVYMPNAHMQLGDDSDAQLALAVAGGYRARFSWSGASPAASTRDGLYVATNYKYLHGFRYERIDGRVRLDTDRNGLVTALPNAPSPLLLVRESSTSGSGVAIDLGLGAVVGPWEVGFGANGVGNRIRWRDVQRATYSMDDIVSGEDDFAEGVPAFSGEVVRELPVDYSGNAGYNADRWTAQAEFGRGYGGGRFRTGYEYRFRAVELRTGAIYSREKWNPTAGVGLNLGKRLSLDAAAFGTTANVARERRTAVALSMRINH